MNKIVFISRFSNAMVRENLSLKKYRLRNFLRHIHKEKPIVYDDFALWTTEYIAEFEKHKEIEFHIVAQHRGLKKPFQNFNNNGIHYHFYKCDGNWFSDFFRSKLSLELRSNYFKNRKRTLSIINRIQPDLIILCGAENPHYGTAVLDIKDKPICVILQTLLNDPKRIEMNVGTPYRRHIEVEVFKHANYFCTTSEEAMSFIRSKNKNAVFFPIRFPTHRPTIDIPKEKECDFVFFARNITKNKGIEDVLEALAIVKQSHQNVVLHVIGGCNDEYRSRLDDRINHFGLQNNVRFLGYFQEIEDSYAKVVRAKVVVIPGITAALNSTVRESMLMGMPTICYESDVTIEINSVETNLLTTKWCDVEELAKTMVYALENPNDIQKIAQNGKRYAEKTFGNEAIVNELVESCIKIIKIEQF